MKNRKSIYFILVVLFVGFTSLLIILANKSFAATLDNDARVAPNSDLTYYIDVIYDGVDADAVTSNDTAVADVRSDYIYVEDKLPDGLIFKNFVTTSDGTIGAVKRSDGTSCPGYVVGDSGGLVYDSSTRTVSFKVKNLQAGCKLTVGVVTTTPSLGTNKRMDFYNTAFARENDFSTKSNTVHAWMGDEEATLYTVTYKYSGDVPEGAPELPATSSYNAGTSVGVLNSPTVAGYTFSGWSSSDVTVTNGTFTMPSANVTFTGGFTAKQTYTVSYSITGDSPDGFSVPSTKKYGVGDDVKVDSLKAGDIVNGYKFLGWTSTIDLSDGIFVMPATDVSIVGSFEEIKYSVSYQFQGSVLPDNANSLLPATIKYAPGETVTVAADPVADGYKFLGWYKNHTFTMPNEDIVIYGEWMKLGGYFKPTISVSINNPKEYYQTGDIVTFNVLVTNTANFEITDVMIQQNLENAKFVDGSNYTVMNDSFVKIPVITANGSQIITAQYTVKNDIVKDYVDVFELTGALASNYYYLDTTADYKVSSMFKVANINLNINLLAKGSDTTLTGNFTLYSDANLSQEVGSGLEFKGLTPGTTYYLKQTRVQSGYVLLPKTYTVVVGEEGNITFDGLNIDNTAGTVTVELVNDEVNMLPNTGGMGNVPYIIIGLLIILASSGGYVFYIKKESGLI